MDGIIIWTLVFLFPGLYCTQDVDECSQSPSPCKNGGTCRNQDGGYMCICVNGWDGPTCEINIDDCQDRPCYNGGTCHDRVGYYYCECPPGKRGDFFYVPKFLSTVNDVKYRSIKLLSCNSCNALPHLSK